VVVSKVIYAKDDVYHEGVYPLPLGADERAKTLKSSGALTNRQDGTITR